MLESNPPRNNQLESHRSDEPGRACKGAPFPYYIISIHLPIPQKLMLL
jgi:hypothetical protein